MYDTAEQESPPPQPLFVILSFDSKKRLECEDFKCLYVHMSFYKKIHKRTPGPQSPFPSTPPNKKQKKKNRKTEKQNKTKQKKDPGYIYN